MLCMGCYSILSLSQDIADMRVMTVYCPYSGKSSIKYANHREGEHVLHCSLCSKHNLLTDAVYTYRIHEANGTVRIS